MKSAVATNPLRRSCDTDSYPALMEGQIHTDQTLLHQRRTDFAHPAESASQRDAFLFSAEEQTGQPSFASQHSLQSLPQAVRGAACELVVSLRQLIGADLVALLRIDAENSNPTHAAAQATSNLEILADGPLQIDGRTWRDWLQTQSASGPCRSLLHHGVEVPAPLLRQHVCSMCAVPIIHRDVADGWLIAIHRLLPQSPAQAERRMSAAEAGLVKAAASMLAAHERNGHRRSNGEGLARGVIRATGHAANACDIGGHSERVGRYAQLLARAVDLSEAECQRVFLSGLLHDIGKIGVPDAILAKPGKLTDDEFALIKRHPEIGAWMIRTMPQLADLLPGILHHHESVDGTGYPDGLIGKSIPLMGRILAIADAYDAMTSDRPYRPGMPRAGACAILTENAGTQWDSALVAAFLTISEVELQRAAIDGNLDGWGGDERSLSGGAPAWFAPRPSLDTLSALADDALPATLMSATSEVFPEPSHRHRTCGCSG